MSRDEARRRPAGRGMVAARVPPAAAPDAAGRRAGVRGRVNAYLQLTKPRISFLLILAAVAGYYLGAGPRTRLETLLSLTAAVALLAAGVFSFNQYLERARDALMRRTRGRPLPEGRLHPRAALVFGAVCSMASLALFALLINPLSATLAALTLVSYLLVYTPLKTRTVLHKVVGAVSGATPPLLGWAAARGELPPRAWILFAVLMLWQFPHFLAIELMYREDYARAGIRILPLMDPRGRRTAAAIVSTIAALFGVSLLAAPAGLVEPAYLFAALPLGASFLYAGARAACKREKREARMLLRASVLYLPLLFLAMALTRA